jgi:predicted HTH transcriptional regulator
VQFYGNVVEKPMPSYQIYRGDVFELVNQATSFVMSRIDNWVGTRSQGDNAEVPTRPELPIDAVKEAIVNAICHRDYTSNASVQVMLFKDRLEILNPGTLPYGLTVQKLHGPHKSLPINPLLADPMYWSGYIEKVGTGTEDIINQCVKYGLKTPEFQQDEDFKVIIWRSSASVSDPEVIQTDPEVIQIDSDRLIVKLRKDPSISRSKLSKELGISERQVRNIMNNLRSKGYLIRQGSDSHGQWVLNEPTEEYNKK